MDDRTIARWRMRTLRLTGERYASPTAVVDGMLAVQSENHRQASWAVASRTDGAVTESQFGELFDAGEILRTHVLRPTWHYVRPADIRWLVELTAPRVRRTFRQLQRGLDLDDAMLDHAARAIVDALTDDAHLTRDALAERLRDAGLPVEGQRLGVMLAHAELECLICSGPIVATKHTYALLDERAPVTRRLDREEAVGELVLRYFQGHGPATERDLAYWATMTLTDIRAGLADVHDRLEHIQHDGRTYWFAEPCPDDASFSPRAHLLLVLDEYHNGYQDSRYVLDVDEIVPRQRGATVGMALVDGQMVGDMRRTVRSNAVSFDVGTFRDLDDSEMAALHDAGDRHGSFIGLDAEVVVTRRT